MSNDDEESICVEPSFQEFWNRYPKKVRRLPAEQNWNNIVARSPNAFTKLDLELIIMGGLERYNQYLDFQGEYHIQCHPEEFPINSAGEISPVKKQAVMRQFDPFKMALNPDVWLKQERWTDEYPLHLCNPTQEELAIDLAHEEEGQSQFNQFWEIYPRKVGKQVAMKAWQKNDCDDCFIEIMHGLQDFIPEFKRREIKYIPHPSTWLNQRRWL